MKAFIKVIAALFFSLSLSSQNEAMRITVLDDVTKEGIPFANVLVTRNGIDAGAGATDFDGKVQIKNITPGFYDVKVTYVNYQPQLLSGVRVDSAKVVSFEINMKNSSIMLDELTVISYRVPMIDPDEPSEKKRKWWKFFSRRK
ncbi:MAG: carboxypeptidase-like regulatory domain-containing protein [Bacteroidia bacterium]|nr:carboxypeptidase-like regulatory domain-containing protein [Bacteroidia bacterium]